jgi:hypothetical protein
MPLRFAKRRTLVRAVSAAAESFPADGGLLSQAFAFDNAAWTKQAPKAVITADATTAPDGTTTADKYTLAEDNPDDSSGAVIQQATSPTGVHTTSVYIKPSSWQWVAFSMYDGSHHKVWFDLTGGLVGTQQAGITGAITASANGYYRISITRTTTGADPYWVMWLVNGDNTAVGTNSGANGVFLWGGRLVTGASP